MQSLYIVGGGVLEATLRNGEGEDDQLRFGPGDYFGEMGLLAGTPASATIAALTPSIVYELTKADLRPILEARPEIAQGLSRAMAQRLAAGRGLARTAVGTPAAKGLSAWLSVQTQSCLNSAARSEDVIELAVPLTELQLLQRERAAPRLNFGIAHAYQRATQIILGTIRRSAFIG
ncbi:MAG: cyclic nucleotide-binding domain-containing protein [Roseiarcus sp.]|uniref:Crp/Fnr family transcriptional regulator n=1 Tax=Roseiarcus sp. TaxID=1969460 RepID=UPI003C3EE9CA